MMSDNLRGILAVLTASTAYVLHDSMAKLLTVELPSSEIILVRGVIGTAMLIIGVFALRATRPLAILFEPMMMVRLLGTGGATVFIILALRYLPLPTVTTVLQATPLIVTAGAALLYGDAVGWRRWAAVCTGFLGVVLIVKPGGGFGDAAWLVLLALAVHDHARPLHAWPAEDHSIDLRCGSGLRRLHADGLVHRAVRHRVGDAVTVCLDTDGGVGGLHLRCDHLHDGRLRTGEIAVVAPFRYVPVPLALLLGFWLWSDVPDAIAWLGIALVLGAGLVHAASRARELEAGRSAGRGGVGSAAAPRCIRPRRTSRPAPTATSGRN